MSNTQNCVCRHRNRHILIFVFILLVSSLTHHPITMAQGRPLPKLLEVSQRREVKQIGSRPPRCERRCSQCTRCEAVQVPVSLQKRLNTIAGKTSSSSDSSSLVGTKYVHSSRTDEFSNYKPMSWKCKCGNFIFNP